jgi:hypothetical protein
MPALIQYPDGGLIGTVVSHAWPCHRADRTEADLAFDAALTAITLITITHIMPPGHRPLPCGNCRGLACCIPGPGRSCTRHLPGAGASSESADSHQEQPCQQRPAGASYHRTVPLSFPAVPAPPLSCCPSTAASGQGFQPMCRTRTPRRNRSRRTSPEAIRNSAANGDADPEPLPGQSARSSGCCPAPAPPGSAPTGPH